MAKKEECVFCTKFKQGAYGQKCSYYGKKPDIDGNPCEHYVDGINSDEGNVTTVQTDAIAIPIKEEPNYEKKIWQFSLAMPWWLWIIVIGLPIRLIIKIFKGSVDYGAAIDIGGIIGTIVNITLLFSLWKLKRASNGRKELFSRRPLSDCSQKSNIVNLLFGSQVGLVFFDILGTLVEYSGYEWALVDILFYCCYVFMSVIMIFVGRRIKNIEKEANLSIDSAGGWFVIYGLISIVFGMIAFCMGRYAASVTEFSNDAALNYLFIYALLAILSFLVDAIYAYNIYEYSKTMSYLFQAWDDKSSKCHKIEASSIYQTETKHSDEELKECPYCGEKIRSGAKKCRYCGEWLEK